MTAIEIFDTIINKDNTFVQKSYSWSGDMDSVKITISLHLCCYINNKDCLTNSAIKSIGFSYPSIEINNPQMMESVKKAINNKLKEYFIANREKILKILDKMIIKTEAQKIKKKRLQQERKEKIKPVYDKLKNMGYEVSKVYSSNHHGVSSIDRKESNKFHKYLIKEGTNIKFATIEIKVNKDNVKIGFKIKTRGKIGCSMEEINDIYKIINDEYKKLKEGIQID